MHSEGLREKIELAMRYELKRLYNDFKCFKELGQYNEMGRFMEESTMDDIKDILSDIKKFKNCTGDLSSFYWYMYELDENGEQRLISLDEEHCKDLPDISQI